jgi:enamine deaminase RidA (YjgF/YER057c/UK114 family)
MPIHVVGTRLQDGDLWSNVVRAGELLFIGGLVASDVRTADQDRSIIAQSRDVLGQLRHAVEDAGGHLGDVVKVNVYLFDLAHKVEFNAVYREFFTRPAPVRTAIQAGLSGAHLVEVEAIAHVPVANT